MIITEKDIFNYVYYPEKLIWDKRKYIDANKQLFSREIKLCEETFAALNSQNTKKVNIILLDKKPVVNFQKQPEYFLAADSVNLDKSISTETYTDSKNNILVKVVFYPEKTKLFIFNEENKPINNFKLNIKPLNKSYQIASSSEPLELPAGLEIESLSIEI